MATCSVDGCGSAVLSRGWCAKHYNRWHRNGHPTEGGRNEAGECIEEGCGRRTVGQGWCEMHYSRYVRQPKRTQMVRAARLDRRCAHCGAPIPIERNARAAYCSRRCKIAARTESGQNREAALRSYYKRRYGLSLDTVEAMRTNGCAICGATGGGGRHGQLHIDHNHKTGRVRGALCDSCNTGLGKFKDDPKLLEAAMLYLIADLEAAT